MQHNGKWFTYHWLFVHCTTVQRKWTIMYGRIWQRQVPKTSLDCCCGGGWTSCDGRIIRWRSSPIKFIPRVLSFCINISVTISHFPMIDCLCTGTCIISRIYSMRIDMDIGSSRDFIVSLVSDIYTIHAVANVHAFDSLAKAIAILFNAPVKRHWVMETNEQACIVSTEHKTGTFKCAKHQISNTILIHHKSYCC